MLRALVLILLAALAACATAPSLRSERDALRAALPSVVLVVTQRPDGKIGYGSGLVVGTPHRVLTNAHVVTDAVQVRVMTWEPSRPTYIPQQGGLARFLFENEAALKPARLLRADPELDFAVLEAEGLEALPVLPWRREPVAPGDRVLALGHPAETVWSFTSGVVSSLHEGMVQTDAAINVGNSGGPLIDTEGFVVGLNTSRLVGATQGIGFARPIAMASGLLDGVSVPLKVDRSDPRRAHTTCQGAAELGSLAYLDCLDVDGFQRYLVLVRRAISDGAGVSAARRSEVEARQEPITAETARKVLELNFKATLGTPPPLFETSGTADERARQRKFTDALAQTREAYVRDVDAQLLQRTGMKLDRSNPRAIQEVLRMGTRVERVAIQGPQAWVEVSGRNVDGSGYRVSELWVLTARGWVERQALLLGDDETLPAGFALPLVDSRTVIELSARPWIEALKKSMP